MLGILGGQFVYMLPMVFMNTFFDKWPMAKSVKEK
jgi:AAT family amino acid transporter